MEENIFSMQKNVQIQQPDGIHVFRSYLQSFKNVQDPVQTYYQNMTSESFLLLLKKTLPKKGLLLTIQGPRILLRKNWRPLIYTSTQLSNLNNDWSLTSKEKVPFCSNKKE